MLPLTLNPSFFWEGNDGNWSTFALQIGTPPLGTLPQIVHVLPSTSGSSIWVVDPQGCPENYDGCPELRGGLFDIAKSSTFDDRGTPEEPYYRMPFGPASSLGHAANARAGLDIVALGAEGNVSDLAANQLVAVYGEDFPWVGVLGLGLQNETLLNDNEHGSLLGRLNSTNIIPSASWAYTAGAFWEDVHASLTFGGYDVMRGDMENALKAILSSDDRNILIDIVEISIQTLEDPVSAGGPFPITTFIDSVVPEIWLPVEACQTFERAFNLTWNEEYEMYLVDDDLHNTLVDRQQSVTFTLAANGSATSNTTEIVLPYAAFDLEASFPLAGIQNTTRQRYFPLKRAENEQQYFLGRTFLQSAYLAVDYGRQEFAITQALYPDRDLRDIKAITRPNVNEGDDGLSTGAIAGIAVGGAAFLALIGILIFFCWRKRNKKQKQKNKSKASTNGDSSISGTTFGVEAWAENVNVTSQEYFADKSEMDDQFKPELDATMTARAHTGFHHRHELSVGSIRRTSQQSGISPGGGMSPAGEYGRRSMSSFGQPSPGSPGGRMSPQGLSGVVTPNSDQNAPFAPAPLFGGRGSPAFELSGESRPQSTDSPVVRPQSGPLPTENRDTGGFFSSTSGPLRMSNGDELFLSETDVSPARESIGLSRPGGQSNGPDQQRG